MTLGTGFFLVRLEQEGKHMASRQTQSDRLQLFVVHAATSQDTFAQDVAAGLAAHPKSLPAKYFYDAAGSRLYERICALPEYYLYRAEQEILATYAAQIQAAIGHLALVEFGPGNASKTRYLLAEYERTGRPFLYCPVDIDETMLQTTATALLQTYTHITIRALHADFAGNPGVIQTLPVGKKAMAFFGSSLGNFTPEESVEFLQRIAAIMGPEEVFLLGIDLKKSPTMLLPAYDDAQGVTAAFNLNVLRRINRELSGDFDLDSFAHVARYNAAHGRIEMHLRSRTAQRVTLAKIDQTVQFAAGETIHTENSYKYTVPEIRDMGSQARLALQQTWFDRQQRFLLALFRPQG
jgi:dimethylhistidine N-methyltransferase